MGQELVAGAARFDNCETAETPSSDDRLGIETQDEEGGLLRGRFNRPRVMMDMFEYQGTKAAELAGEDYAAQRRVHSSHASSFCATSLCGGCSRAHVQGHRVMAKDLGYQD